MIGDEACRYNVCVYYTDLLDDVLICALYVLYAYMSWQFSKPLQQGWKEMYPEYRRAIRY